MSEYAVARLEDIGEISDGREPWRPVRHHFGITSFGINAWTGRETGDRIINEHDEEGEDEELYFVQSGRARFELDGERLDAPAGTFVFARPGVKRTAFAEEPQTTILAVGATPGRVYRPTGWVSAKHSQIAGISAWKAAGSSGVSPLALPKRSALAAAWARAPAPWSLVGHVPAHELGEPRNAEVDVSVVLGRVDQTLVHQSLAKLRHGGRGLAALSRYSA